MRDISKTIETPELEIEEPTGILEREGMSERKQRLPPGKNHIIYMTRRSDLIINPRAKKWKERGYTQGCKTVASNV